ncbi:MAG: O-antigen ligase family protein [Patescibacteria group bacterium]
MNILILLYFLFFAFLSHLNLKTSILVILFALPSYLIRFSILSIPTNLLELMVLTVTLFFVLKNYKKIFKNLKDKREEKQAYPFSWEIVIILTMAFVSVFISSSLTSALGIFKAYFLEPILLFIIIVNTFRSDRDIKKIIYTISASALIVSLFAIWQKITGQFIFNEFWANEENRRVVSFFGYPNAVALYLGPLIPLSLALFIQRTKEKASFFSFFEQLFLFVCIVSSFLAIYFSKSKGGLIAVSLSILISVFILIKKKYKILILTILIITSSFLFYAKKDLIDLKLSSSLSYQIRLTQWEETMEMLKKEGLIFGVGLASYQERVEAYHQEGIFFNKDADPDFKRKIVIFDDKYRAQRWQPLEIYLYPHNIFLNFWTEIGIIGAITFIFLIFKLLYMSVRHIIKNKNNKEKYIFLGLFSSVLVILIHGMFDVPYFKNDLSIIFWLIASLLAIYQLKDNKKWKKKT